MQSVPIQPQINCPKILKKRTLPFLTMSSLLTPDILSNCHSKNLDLTHSHGYTPTNSNYEVSTPMRCIAPMDVVSKAELRSENTHEKL